MREFAQPNSGARQNRIAHNEDLCRDLNERKAAWIESGHLAAGFRCECWDLGCSDRIKMSGPLTRKPLCGRTRARDHRVRNGRTGVPALLAHRETRRGRRGGGGDGVTVTSQPGPARWVGSRHSREQGIGGIAGKALALSIIGAAAYGVIKLVNLVTD